MLQRFPVAIWRNSLQAASGQRRCEICSGKYDLRVARELLQGDHYFGALSHRVLVQKTGYAYSPTVSRSESSAVLMTGLRRYSKAYIA